MKPVIIILALFVLVAPARAKLMSILMFIAKNIGEATQGRTVAEFREGGCSLTLKNSPVRPWETFDCGLISQRIVDLAKVEFTGLPGELTFVCRNNQGKCLKVEEVVSRRVQYNESITGKYEARKFALVMYGHFETENHLLRGV